VLKLTVAIASLVERGCGRFAKILPRPTKEVLSSMPISAHQKARSSVALLIGYARVSFAISRT
jgi:hypothetical protein